MFKLSALLASAALVAGPAAAQPVTAPVRPVFEPAVPQAQTAAWQAALSRRENALAVRLDALAKLRDPLFMDAAFVGRLQQLVVDRGEPAELRLAAFGQLFDVFWTMLHPPKAGHRHGGVEGFLAAARSLLDDPDPRLQRAGLSVLAITADQAALARVQAQLTGSRSLAIEPAEAISLLSFVDAAPYWPAIHEAYRRSRDPAVRVEALRVLGRYQPARDDLLAAAAGPEEPPAVRIAALGSLFGVDRQAFLKVAAPLLNEQGRQSDAVKAFAIQAMRAERSTPPARQRKLQGFDDAFDASVRALRQRERGELAEAARQYLFDTDPNYSERAIR